MNRQVAEQILSVVLQSTFVLDSYLLELRDKLEPEEFKDICLRFGKIMGEAHFEVLSPLWKQYPDLLPDKMGGPYKTNQEHYRNIYNLVVSQVEPLRNGGDMDV